ncbi:MAG: homocysteine S-methyltransferase family protein [Deltaproteobacteria bacterium]|nr:homocysteine S-methyltransferase family protein [Deltaproteobacteria bacterium]
MARLLARDAQGLVLDGALGTQLLDNDGLSSSPTERVRPRCGLSVDDPDRVRTVYAAYFAAGADAIHTNSFGATRHDLVSAGRSDVRAINLGAALLAREVRPAGRWIIGDVSPPWRPDLDEATLIDGHAEQASFLMEGGVDALHLETQHAVREVVAGLAGLGQGAPGLPIWISFALSDAGLESVSGVPLAELVAAVGPDQPGRSVVLGLNCSLRPERMLEAFTLARALDPRFLLFQPITGDPDVGPTAFAAACHAAFEKGAHAVGGCCGTTPEHIRAIRPIRPGI